MTTYKHTILVLAAVLLAAFPGRAQFFDCGTGLMQMPTADMQKEATFMVTTSYLNQHSTATRWDYDTVQYCFAVAFWERLEIGYVLTIFNGAWDPDAQTVRERIIRNQDRHFSARFALLREGDFFDWMPGLVVGTVDPTTASTNYEYWDADVNASGNAYFNKNYVVLSKHFRTAWGEVGTHVGYQGNRRRDYPVNGPCGGVNWKPVWTQGKGLLDFVNLMAEYDSRTFNVGLAASVWRNHFEAVFELQNLRWINAGLRFKMQLK